MAGAEEPNQETTRNEKKTNDKPNFFVLNDFVENAALSRVYQVADGLIYVIDGHFPGRGSWRPSRVEQACECEEIARTRGSCVRVR